MRILIDLSNSNSIYEGVSIYALNILSGFKANNYADIIILCSPQIFSFVKEYFPDYTCLKFNSSYKRNNIFYKNLSWYKQIKTINCDIVFSPIPDLSHIITPKKIVQTIHDIQPLKLYRRKNKIKYWILFFLIILRSYKIISISNYVATDLKKKFPIIFFKKVKVIYNCVRINNVKTNPPIADKYILYISSLWSYKNVFTLVKSFNLIKEKIPHKLVIIGKPIGSYWTEIVVPFIKNNKLSSRIIHIDQSISNDTITQYFQHADLFVHPSLMEGFGFTPIEASMYKIPVLTTKETAIFETTLGALNYYEPAKDSNVLAKEILYLLENPPSNKKLEEISILFQKKYDCATQAKKVFEYINMI